MVASVRMIKLARTPLISRSLKEKVLPDPLFTEDLKASLSEAPDPLFTGFVRVYAFLRAGRECSARVWGGCHWQRLQNYSEREAL